MRFSYGDKKPSSLCLPLKFPFTLFETKKKEEPEILPQSSHENEIKIELSLIKFFNSVREWTVGFIFGNQPTGW